jgi:hypothetical protein
VIDSDTPGKYRPKSIITVQFKLSCTRFDDQFISQKLSQIDAAFDENEFFMGRCRYRSPENVRAAEESTKLWAARAAAEKAQREAKQVNGTNTNSNPNPTTDDHPDFFSDFFPPKHSENGKTPGSASKRANDPTADLSSTEGTTFNALSYGLQPENDDPDADYPHYEASSEQDKKPVGCLMPRSLLLNQFVDNPNIPRRYDSQQPWVQRFVLLNSGIEQRLKALQHQINFLEKDNVGIPAIINLVNQDIPKLLPNTTHIQSSTLASASLLPNIIYPYGSTASQDLANSQHEYFFNLFQQPRFKHHGCPSDSAAAPYYQALSRNRHTNNDLGNNDNGDSSNTNRDPHCALPTVSFDERPVISFNHDEVFIYAQWLQFQSVALQVFNFTTTTSGETVALTASTTPTSTPNPTPTPTPNTTSSPPTPFASQAKSSDQSEGDGEGDGDGVPDSLLARNSSYCLIYLSSTAMLYCFKRSGENANSVKLTLMVRCS